MLYSDQQAAAKLQELGLPPIFMEIWKSGNPRSFCIHWKRPDNFIRLWQALVKRFNDFESLVPLLESNGDHLLAYDAKRKNFVEYFLGDYEFNSIGKTYQQFLSSIFVDLGDAGLADIVEEVAGSFGYRHLEKFRKFMAINQELSFEEAKQVFVESIPD